MRKDFKGDSIVIKLSGGDASAGNGGDGYNYGNIINKPNISMDTYNKAEGSDVHTNTGDKVYQKASWEAEAGKTDSKGHEDSKRYEDSRGHDKYKAHDGGGAQSNGDQESEHNGYNKSGDVSADTSATQTNAISADQHQYVWAGVGGDGGEDSKAYGGDVDIDLGHLLHQA